MRSVCARAYPSVHATPAAAAHHPGVTSKRVNNVKKQGMQEEAVYQLNRSREASACVFTTTRMPRLVVRSGACSVHGSVMTGEWGMGEGKIHSITVPVPPIKKV